VANWPHRYGRTCCGMKSWRCCWITIDSHSPQ
jgi:hypothetical protein